MSETQRTSVFWIGALFLAAAGITIATFYSLIIPEYRHLTFYQVIVASCLAELIFFGCLAYVISGKAPSRDPGHAVRLRIMVLVVFWTLGIIISGAVATSSKFADSLYSDKILIWQLIASFLILLGVYFFHRQQIVIEEKQAGPERQRSQLQSYTLGVDRLLGSLRNLPGNHPDRAVQLDQLCKRLETLKSQLRGVLPAGESRTDRLVEPESADRVEQSLRKVHEQIRQLTAAGPESFQAEFDLARNAVDDAIATLRHRQNALTL
jgi:hypothetical protein